jgi:MscS family membrane protein
MLPPVLVGIEVLHLALWQWIGLVGLVPASWLLSWLAERGVARLLRPLVRRTRNGLDDRLADALAGPLRLLLAVALFAAAALLALGLPAEGWKLVAALSRGLVLVAVGWLSFRVTDMVGEAIHARLVERGQHAATAVVPLGRRAAKVAVAALVLLGVLDDAGVNVAALLAGLGVGGLAVALAAKTSIENFFGGVTLVADQPVGVGDFCRFGDRVGTVEDVGLRSTRIRTLDRTLVSIPNASFSQMELENYSRRDRMWYHPTLGLRYETTPDQIRYVLVEIRRMLYGHPKVDPDPARIRFAGFGSYSLNLDVFAYVDVTDYGVFLEVVEDLNLRIMEIVERAGTAFAFPSQTTYVRPDEGLDGRRVRAAEEEVAHWRQEERLYLPCFPPEEVARLRATLTYPERGSVAGSDGPCAS